MRARQPLAALIAYGLPALGLEATTFMASLYLVKFATVSLGIAPVVVGAILAAGRIWDAASDPLVGYASDRTRTRLGRRRPWMLAGAPLLGLCFAALWVGVGEPGSGLRVAAFALATVGFYSAVTLVAVPHSSLGASLASDPHERNRLFAARGLLKNLGLAGALVAVYQLESAPSLGAAAAGTGVALGAAAALAVLVGACALREPPTQHEQPRGSLKALRAISRLPSARRILAVLGLQELAIGALLVALPFTSEYVLEAPGQTAFYLVCFVVPMTFSIPVWVRVSRGLGVYRSWQAGNAIEAVGFVPLLLVGPGDTLWVMFAASLIGIGHGAGRVLAMTALADSADAEARSSGEAKEGMFYAASTFVEKCAAGMAAFAVGGALSAVGFDAASAPTPATLAVLRFTVSVGPAVLLAASCMALAGGTKPLSRRGLVAARA